MWHSAVVKGAKRTTLGGHRRTRRTGVLALVLLLVTTAVVLMLVSRYRAVLVAPLVVILGGLPVLYVQWAGYRDDRREAAKGEGLTLAAIADELAVAVKLVRPRDDAKPAFELLAQTLLVSNEFLFLN